MGRASVAGQGSGSILLAQYGQNLLIKYRDLADRHMWRRSSRVDGDILKLP
jgi:hypothetical protein